MTRTMWRTLMTMAFTLALGAGCSEPEAPATAPEEEVAIDELSVEQAAARLEAGAVAVDANGPGTRRENGVVPGAVLLTSSGTYDCDAELPADHSAELIFYCGGVNCRASDGAARRALAAGWENVHVMRPGISGWVEAGRDTSEWSDDTES